MAANDSSAWIRDAGDADFASVVLERSAELPVVVDFWAPWCGPCRNLTPILESLADEHAGAFVLVRVNVDESPQIAGQLAVRSIPLVIAFRDGAAISEFSGAQPEAAVRQFLASILPSEADRLVEAASRESAPEAAESLLQVALGQEPRHPGALLAMAQLHGDRGEPERAQELLEQITSATPALEQQAERLAAELRTRQGGGGADEQELRARLERDPNDLAVALELARALCAGQRYDEALPALLALVERDKSFQDEAARKAMLDVFEVLGGDDPRTQEYRSKLAQALFK
jgi:putative thioredoxin